jgi:hypothetical protein
MFGGVAIVAVPILIRGVLKSANMSNKAFFIALIFYGTTLDGYGTSIYGFLLGLLASPYGRAKAESRGGNCLLNNRKDVMPKVILGKTSSGASSVSPPVV